MGKVAVTAHERVAEATKAMTDAVYAALDAIDGYRETVNGVVTEQETTAEPNGSLIKRMQQFAGRAEAMTGIIEDQVLDHLNFCNDRLFSVELAERGEFI